MRRTGWSSQRDMSWMAEAGAGSSNPGATRAELARNEGVVITADAGATETLISGGGAIFARNTGRLILCFRWVMARSPGQEVDVNEWEARTMAMALEATSLALREEWRRWQEWDGRGCSSGPLSVGMRLRVTEDHADARVAWRRDAAL